MLAFLDSAEMVVAKWRSHNHRPHTIKYYKEGRISQIWKEQVLGNGMQVSKLTYDGEFQTKIESHNLCIYKTEL
jgi:hypothetical protein